MSCSTIIRQSLHLVSFCLSLMMPLKKGTVRECMTFTRLPCFCTKAYGKTKYAYVILLYLTKTEALILSESDAHNLKWNRTFNKHGMPGMNIPLDLRTERYNCAVKSMWRSLGSNINEDSATRVTNTVEPREAILDTIRHDCGLPEIQGYRSAGNSEVPVLQVIRDLVQINAFKYEAGREEHPSFPKFPSSLLRNLVYHDLHTWMNDLLKTWETIYELNRV